MILVTVFLFNSEPNGIPFGSKNPKENCHHDHIPFKLKGNGIIVFSPIHVIIILYYKYVILI